MTKTKKEVLRTCIVCKKQFLKEDLVRVVRTTDSGVVVDNTGKINGRGAYISKSEDVVNDKSLRFRIQNALKVKISDEEYEKFLSDIKEGAMLE
ncbi:YlxR family protein [uncultured Ezakiella sp.]|uniref:RNase P modulator RnpM n=1 Tax=uncultured Ezakiella sp. TaxID=1637529 RepID=UPI0025FB3AF7|nr:YlxR family protein [uncultured Ezakiella sp.]